MATILSPAFSPISEIVLKVTKAPLIYRNSARTLRLAVKKRNNAEKNYAIYNRFDHLKLAQRTDMPNKWIVQKEEKIIPPSRNRRSMLTPLEDYKLPYQKYSEADIERIQKKSDYFDPLFKPDVIKDYVNPQEEPFKSIYASSQDEGIESEYTRVKNITTPELWSYVERLAKIRIAPKPVFRKNDQPIVPTACGYIPPTENPPDLPYFVARTRNYVLPVYYRLHEDPQECHTIVRRISGDLWQFEEELRMYLESLSEKKRRILTSVQEPDGCVLFRGKHLSAIVDWLHSKGF